MAKDRALGLKIRGLRKGFDGESQAAFGSRLGVEQGTVSRWENGEIPKRTLWKKISQLAGVPTGDFFFGVEADEDEAGPTSRVRVPKVSWLSAGKFAEASAVVENEVEEFVYEDLAAGDWLAFDVVGDSMNVVAPDGSRVFVNRAQREPISGCLYAFVTDDGATFKRFRANPDRLEPMSTNPTHETRFLQDIAEIAVIGRVEKVVNNLI